MARTEFLVRARPHRAAVLLPWDANAAQCLRAVSFLSRLWGGRYCPLIPVKTDGENRLAEEWLKKQRPDVVFGLDVDHEAWSKVCRELCQSYAYAQFPDQIEELFDRSPLEFISAWQLYRQVIEKNPVIEESKSNVVLLEIDGSCDLAPYFAATFGLEEEKATRGLQEALKARVHSFKGHVDVAEYVRLCGSMRSKLSLLDLASYRLEQRVGLGAFAQPPSIIVADALGADTALFWNTRMAAGTGSCGRFLMFPAEKIDEGDTVTALADWIGLSAKRSNYCEIMSLSANSHTLEHLADKLAPCVRAQGVEHVDLYWGEMDVPLVIPYDQEVSVPVDLEDRLVQCLPPVPRFQEFIGRDNTWVVDLVKDVATGRRPLDLFPPANTTALHVLNAPFPPNLVFKHVYDVREGCGAVSIRCHKGSGSIRWWVPTDAEMLEGILQGAEVSVGSDEKRRAYEPAIEMFGGLAQAARAFSGASCKMLSALHEGPQTRSRLMRVARAGDKTRPTDPEPAGMEYIGEEVSKRIATERFKRYLAQQHPPSEQAPNVLVYWEKRGVLSREATLPPCPSCNLSTRLDRLDLDRAVRCPHCGASFRLPDRIDLRYRLSPLVTKAMEEGLGPVILTGRFLKQLTNEGFMWLAGVKGVFRGKSIDVDIIACCDGHLVLAECKNMAESSAASGTWSHIIAQVSGLVDLAKACRADLVVLSFMGAEVPAQVIDFANTNSSGDLAIHTLTGRELEKGRRFREVKAGAEQKEAPMWIEDFLPQRGRLQPSSERAKGPRHVGF